MRLGSLKLGQDLKFKMGEVHNAVLRRLDTSIQNGTGPNSDNLSWAMFRFIEPIREISLIGDKDSIYIAYKLLRSRKTLSWTSKVPGQGERAPDNSADEFLASLVRKWKYSGKTASKEWWVGEQKDLQKQVDDTAKHGIKPWYPETMKAISEALEPSTEPEDANVKVEA